jgi:ubiquinone/menaquinone biosynthesis C-methylase UbiE
MSRPKRCPARFAFVLEHPLRRKLLNLDHLVDSLMLQPGWCVLDLGAGSGVVAAHIAARLPRGELVLIDAQGAMLTRARRRVPSHPGLSVALVAADAEHVPLSDASVDLALLVTVLGEIDDRALAIQEVHRVLRDGGILSISEHLPDPDFRSVTSVRRLVCSTGFEERDYLGSRWSYTINFVKRERVAA